MKTGTTVFVIGIAVVAVAVGVVTFLNRAATSGSDLVLEVDSERKPVRIVVVNPERLVEILEHSGALEAKRDVVLTAEVAGKITAVRRDLGDSCKKGEELVQLDREPYRIALMQAAGALKQASAARNQAKRDLERIEVLNKKGVSTPAELDRAQAAVETADAVVDQAKAAAGQAQRNVRVTTVRCPFDGQVAQRMVDVGQAIAPQTPLMRLVDASELKLTLSVSSAKLARLQVGQSVGLFDSSLPDQPYKGTIARLGIAADQRTRTFPVEIVVPVDAAGPRPGQVVRARIEVAVHRDALAVPYDALMQQQGSPTLCLAHEDTVRLVGVVPGARIDERVIIVKGLQTGDRVITLGCNGLENGSTVSVVNADVLASSAAAPERSATQPPAIEPTEGAPTSSRPTGL